MLTDSPEFPENKHGLKNGSYIEAKHPDVEEQLGIKVGDYIPLGWTGECVRFRDFTWSVDQLCSEIDAGYWRVVSEKVVDFSDPAEAIAFKMYCS